MQRRALLLALALSACGSTPLSQQDGSARDGGAASGECRGPGRYEAGKEGSYRPCCPGLTEVFYKKAAYVNGAPACADFPLRVYACVAGTCGDGVCEAGESEPCGCVADCPGARWGSDPAPAGKMCGGIAGLACEARQFCELAAGVCDTVKDAAGACQKVPESCDDIYEPVCGCDGKTYGNDCARLGAGVAKDHDGACAP